MRATYHLKRANTHALVGGGIGALAGGLGGYLSGDENATLGQRALETLTGAGIGGAVGGGIGYGASHLHTPGAPTLTPHGQGAPVVAPHSESVGHKPADIQAAESHVAPGAEPYRSAQPPTISDPWFEQAAPQSHATPEQLQRQENLRAAAAQRGDAGPLRVPRQSFLSQILDP